jgi:multimeric flavodoxin WrbA
MKVVAFNGSPKASGNTNSALEMVACELRKEGMEVEIVHVGNKLIRGCLACGQCRVKMDEKCIIKDDNYVNEWIQKMKEADGIILGSPVHYSAIAGTMKSFLDRAFYVMGGSAMLRNKVGAAVVAVRRSGGIPTFNQLNNFLNYCEMVMPTSNYWNVIHGTTPGDTESDLEIQSLMLKEGRSWVF